MELSTKASERLTAVLSTLAAVVILAAGVTAQQLRTPPADEVARLESDLRYRLTSQVGVDVQQAQAQLAQLDQVLAAWRHCDKTETDRRLLADWLLEANVRAMSDANKLLPPMPDFGRPSSTLPDPTFKPLPESLDAKQLDGDSFRPEGELEPVPVPLELSPSSDPLPPLEPTPAEPPAIPVPVEQPAFEEYIETEPAPTVPTVKQAAAASRGAPVQVNLDELATRIAVCHDNLDELNSQLQAGDGVSAEQLPELLQRLERLCDQVQFVDLYFQMLSADEQASMMSPPSPRNVVAEFARQLERLEAQWQSDPFGEFDSSDSEELIALREHLAVVAKKTAPRQP